MTNSRALSEKRIEKSDEAFRSIGEAAGELGLETHVIRYWETRFPRDVKPVKRPDGRRLFRPEDMDALRAVQCLVHDHGLTLKNAKRVLDEQGVDAVLAGTADIEAPLAAQDNPARALQNQLSDAFTKPAQSLERQQKLASMLPRLNSVKTRLDAAIASSAR
jgi:DNA-binding transcriptional MerR regulator